MTRIRVYELAKELGLTSKDLIEKISDLDLDINSHMSTMEEEEAELIKELLKEDSDVVRFKNKEKKNTKGDIEKSKDIIELDEEIIVRDLAEKLDVSTSQIISKLIPLGIMVNQNQPIDFEKIGRASCRERV